MQSDYSFSFCKRACLSNGPLSHQTQNPDSSFPCFEDISLLISEFCCMSLLCLSTADSRHLCIFQDLCLAQREQPDCSQTVFRVTLWKHHPGNCLAPCSFHQSKKKAIEKTSFLFVYAKTMGTLTSHSLSDTAYKIREEITMFGSCKKIQSVQISLADIPTFCFSKLRIMEVPFPPLSASLSLISKADHTWNERQDLKVMEKHI